MKLKKIPMRKCVGCGGHFSKKELIRVVKTPDGEVLADATGRANGRGAYLCKKKDCLDRAWKTRALERSLGIHLTAEEAEALKKEFEE